MANLLIQDEDNGLIILESKTLKGSLVKSSITKGLIDGTTLLKGGITLDRIGTNVPVVSTGFVSQAQWLIVEKFASEELLEFRMIRFIDANTVSYAKPNGTLSEAKPRGITISRANPGEKVKILVTGFVEDSSFHFPNDTLLFLGPNGTITNTVPVSGYSTVIGESLVLGVICLSIRPPIKL